MDARGALGFVAEFLWCFVRTAMKSSSGRDRSGFARAHVCNPPETYWPLARFWKRLAGASCSTTTPSRRNVRSEFDAPGGPAPGGLHWLERKTFRRPTWSLPPAGHKRIAIRRAEVPGDVVVRSGPDLERLTVYPPDPAGATAAATCSSTSARSASRTGSTT